MMTRKIFTNLVLACENGSVLMFIFVDQVLNDESYFFAVADVVGYTVDIL